MGVDRVGGVGSWVWVSRGMFLVVGIGLARRMGGLCGNVVLSRVCWKAGIIGGGGVTIALARAVKVNPVNLGSGVCWCWM